MSLFKARIYYFFLFFSITFLVSCNKNDLSDLQAFVKSINDKYKNVANKESLDFNVPNLQINYNARNPFQNEIGKTEHKVINEKNFSNPLENFSLDDLHYVGAIRVDKELWAAISDPDGMIYKVKDGDFIGSSHGEIISIEPEYIRLKVKESGSNGTVITSEIYLRLDNKIN